LETVQKNNSEPRCVRPIRGWRAWSTTLHERVAGRRMHALGSGSRGERGTGSRLRARAGKPASWAAISVLIRADVAGLARCLLLTRWRHLNNSSLHPFSSSLIKQLLIASAACLFAARSLLHPSRALLMTALVGELWQGSGKKGS